MLLRKNAPWNFLDPKVERKEKLKNSNALLARIAALLC